MRSDRLPPDPFPPAPFPDARRAGTLATQTCADCAREAIVVGAALFCALRPRGPGGGAATTHAAARMELLACCGRAGLSGGPLHPASQPPILARFDTRLAEFAAEPARLRRSMVTAMDLVVGSGWAPDVMAAIGRIAAAAGPIAPAGRLWLDRIRAALALAPIAPAPMARAAKAYGSELRWGEEGTPRRGRGRLTAADGAAGRGSGGLAAGGSACGVAGGEAAGAGGGSGAVGAVGGAATAAGVAIGGAAGVAAGVAIGRAAASAAAGHEPSVAGTIAPASITQGVNRI
jgi:hypothetical protein